MKLSVTKIEEFSKCRYSYYLSNVSGEKTEGQDSAELIKGEEIHKLFEEAYKDVIAQNKEEIIKAVEEKVRNDPNYEKYKSHADNFLVLQKKIGTIPLYREIKLYDQDLNISGIIDRVDYDGNDLIIIDYKTGKEKQLKDHHFQLAIYTYLFCKIHNQTPTHWGIYYSDTGNLKVEKVNWNIVTKAQTRVSVIRREITKAIENNNFPKSPSYLCKWCRHYNKNNGKCDAEGKTYR